MYAYKNFETVVTANITVQKQTPQHNTLCSYPGCRQNCHVGCQLGFSTNPDSMRQCWAFDNSNSTQCRICTHSVDYHHHDHTIWEVQEDKQKKVDVNAKKKFEDAALDKTKLKRALDEVKKASLALDQTISSTTVEIGQLCRSYAMLSLSGSFSAQIRKSIKLMEVHLESLEGDKQADPQTIRSVRDAIANLEQQYQVLAKAATCVPPQVAAGNATRAGSAQNLFSSVRSRFM